MKDFDGKVALVTGTTGIGLATARRLAAGGAAIIACGIDRAANAAMKAELESFGHAARILDVDVSVSDQVRDAIADGVERFGGLDVIVNSAAVHPYGTATTTDWETWNRAMTVNVGSIYLTAHFGIPQMVKRGGGAIVNVASVQGFACQRNVAAYATTKGAIHTRARWRWTTPPPASGSIRSARARSAPQFSSEPHAATMAAMPMSKRPTGASAPPIR